jgi:ankyrin repeat protein
VLVAARTNLEPPYHYFTGATLLHHVAGNPGREQPLPGNIVEIAQLLLDAGADVNAVTLGPNGGDTMGLVITSRQASDMDVSGPLMDLLLERGATLDLAAADALDASLANHAPRAAEKMIALGATPDIFAAAALGRMDLLRHFFDDDGRLRSRPRRHDVDLSERDAIGLAMLYAYVRDQREAVDYLLEKDGNWNMVGVNNGTALHRAACAGDIDVIQRLVAKGADVSDRNNPFNSTPLGWADHNKQTAVLAWLRDHCVIDLHDAVSFDMRDHIEARLRADPASADARIDHWDIPQGTPLHSAAALDREEAAKVLLANGADPNILDANGMTARDVAEHHGATAVAALLARHGGTRTSGAATADHRKLKPFERIAHGMADAGVRGFASRAGSAKAVDGAGGSGRTSAMPPYSVDEERNAIEMDRPLDDEDWDAVFTVMAERRISAIAGNGHLTDAAIERIAKLDHVTTLNLGGSNQLTDAGLQHLARMPQLQEIDLSGWDMQITDRGLGVLRHLTELRRFQMCWPQRVSDAGVANLAACDQLERVDLLGTPTGDGAITALTGKHRLGHVKTGKGVTDAGLRLFHRFPAFRSPHAGRVNCSLMSFDAGANHLLIDGPFSNTGLASLGRLEGVAGLSFFWHVSRLTADGLQALIDLPNLEFLGCEGQLCNDEAMRHIAALLRLRMLMAQGTVATDAGFAALSRSPTIEYIWGRECPNLTGRGFTALSAMPALRGLGVSCKNVDDQALATLPRFPALRQLMPMDVTDAGFRHVGRCENLESLWCMYCRDTTDVATGHLAGLSKLKTYYAGQTRITDRSLEILGRIPSLEKLEFWNCAGITDAGVALLAALPQLREVTVDGCRQVTAQAIAAFPAHVRIRVS